MRNLNWYGGDMLRTMLAVKTDVRSHIVILMLSIRHWQFLRIIKQWWPASLPVRLRCVGVRTYRRFPLTDSGALGERALPGGGTRSVASVRGMRPRRSVALQTNR